MSLCGGREGLMQGAASQDWGHWGAGTPQIPAPGSSHSVLPRCPMGLRAGPGPGGQRAAATPLLAPPTAQPQPPTAGAAQAGLGLHSSSPAHIGAWLEADTQQLHPAQP